MSLPFEPSLCAEFPNDNPALHAGASWICLDPGSPLRPVVRPGAPRTKESNVCPARAQRPENASGCGGAGREAIASLEPAGPPPSEPWPEDVAEAVELWLGGLVVGKERGTDAGEEAGVTGAGTVGEATADLEPPDETVTEGALDEASTDDPAAPEADPFAAFTAALVEVALASGATRAAAILPRWLEGEAIDSAELGDLGGALSDAGLGRWEGSALRASAREQAIARAWRGILRGEQEDLSACGDSTLDGWAAGLLEVLGIRGEGDASARRALRKRGVAAFGMLVAA